MQTLRTLRLTSSKLASNRLNIQPLDRLLHIFRGQSTYSDTEAIPAWSSSPEESEVISQGRVLQPKPAVIEIIGTSTCSGKTHLLYYIAALSVLPSSFEGQNLRGRGAAVVIFDTDGRFDVRRLRQVMKHHVDQCLHGQQEQTQLEEAGVSDKVEKLLHSALFHAHIFRPQSSASWLSTLQSLSKYLLQSQDHFSSGRALSAVLLDSVSAFFWQDRQNEAAYQYDAPSLSDSTSTFNQIYSSLVKELRDIQSRFDCTIVATNWGLIPLQPTRPNAPPSFRPHLPLAWTNFCTLRLIIERDSVAKFGPVMSAEEASRDADARQQKVERGGFSAWVDSTRGTEIWPDGIRKGLKNVEGKGFIWFRITNDGVDMDL
jgi:hypothetical protein